MTSDHNAARWLEVRWLPQAGGRQPSGCCIRFRPAGWYVVRTCKCHTGVPVTVPLPSEWRAERAKRAMLAASEVLGT